VRRCREFARDEYNHDDDDDDDDGQVCVCVCVCLCQVKVEIVDVNDNSPVFPERRISHDISELAEPGTALAVPAATDLDSGRNAIYRYDVVPRDRKWELTSRATADGGTDLRLVLRERLDRELEDGYLVTVLAVDGGDPPKTGSVTVNISVLDANDNNPQFDNSSYEVSE